MLQNKCPVAIYFQLNLRPFKVYVVVKREPSKHCEPCPKRVGDLFLGRFHWKSTSQTLKIGLSELFGDDYWEMLLRNWL